MSKKEPAKRPKKTVKKKKGKQETVMIICAHPDDEVLGAGGAISKYASEGKSVVAVIFSYGEKSHWWLKKRYTVEMRVAESKKAGQILGITDTIFLGMKDFDLKNEMQKPENLDLLQKVIMRYYPDRIFTHSPDDIIYADHKAVWDSVETVLDRLHYKGDVYVFNIWGQEVRVSKNPKLFVDISETFHLKTKALKCFKSQMMYIFQLLPGVYWRAFKLGRLNKTRYAEEFTKIR
ncbi:TPA: PIG-L family deacetylase [Candidatus Woesearchaeota archaeon]|nr:PIG-L family deacetylase [Candidatus Woesearchaeota archaeon]